MPWQLRHSWPVAELGSVTELAERLELDLGQLQWLADTRSLERTVSAERLRNYRYALVPRRSGIARVIEAPKARLKEIQRSILHEILTQVPVHEAAHGFVERRSVITAAAAHTGHAAVLRIDLKDFFASIRAARVYGVFTTLGYPLAVAHMLTGLCTNVIPQMVWAAMPEAHDPQGVSARYLLGRSLATPHLPQGAPTSPALANLIAYRLDRRLAGLARSFGAEYTRYADDLTFSGSRILIMRRALVEQAVGRIAAEEGFTVNAAKSRLQPQASRQTVCGVVVNSRPNLARGEYEQLKAILHNCARFGPSSQNRERLPDFEAHLRGRVSWASSLNPDRGLKLRRQLQAIDWSR
jgi:RNA-directed DNA polymerase